MKKVFFVILAVIISTTVLTSCMQRAMKPYYGSSVAEEDESSKTETSENSKVKTETSRTETSRIETSKNPYESKYRISQKNINQLREIEKNDTFGVQIINERFESGVLLVDVKNECGETIVGFSVFAVFYTDEGYIMSGLGGGFYGFDFLPTETDSDERLEDYLFYGEAKLNFRNGETKTNIGISNSNRKIENFKMIAYSYTTESGEVVYNPSAVEWWEVLE